MKHSEQDWLKTNLAKFSRMLQGQKRPPYGWQAYPFRFSRRWFQRNRASSTRWTSARTNEPCLKLPASYAHRERKNVDNRFKLGDDYGQRRAGKGKNLLTSVPKDYITIEHTGKNPLVLPVVTSVVKAVITCFLSIVSAPRIRCSLITLTEYWHIVFNTIEVNTCTEASLR